MDYRNLRFMGCYVHEDQAHERAQAAIKQEIESRDPQKNGGNLLQPDQSFKDAVVKFRDDYRTFGEALLKKAGEGGQLDRIELKTLDRAERLYATALGTTMERAPLRLSFLDAGTAMHGKGCGLSLTRQVEIAAGIVDAPHGKNSGQTVEVSHNRF